MDATITKVPVIVLTKDSQYYEISPFVEGSMGIASGTLNLQTGIVTEELDFGNLTASELSLEIYNIYFDLQGFNIQLILEDSTTHDRITLFTGVVDSSKEDTFGASRQVVAYDWAYYHRSDNVASWWNDFWHGVNNRANATLKEIRDSLMQYMGFNASTETYLNDSIVIPNNFELATTLDFETALKFVCELQATFPHIDANGNMEFISLSSTSTDIQGTYEGSNSSWEDYTTDAITGIGIYSTSDDLAQVVGTDANVYNIAGNLLVLTLDASTITTMCNNILQALATVQFVPCEINMIMSDFDLSLGQKIETEKGYSYVMQNVYHGICMVDEMISCKALGKKLSQDVASYNNTMMNGAKVSKIEKDIDGIVTTVSAAVVEAHEAAEDAEEALEQVGQYDTRISTVESSITQHANEIVMKVDDNGRIVQAALTTDPDEGTEFKVSADNISFIANGVMQLSANNLQIDSTNFKVDEYGNVTANSGNIGCTEITKVGLITKIDSIDSLPYDSNEGAYYYEEQVRTHSSYSGPEGTQTTFKQHIIRMYYDETNSLWYVKFCEMVSGVKPGVDDNDDFPWMLDWDDPSIEKEDWRYFWGDESNPPDPVPDYFGYHNLYIRYVPESESSVFGGTSWICMNVESTDQSSYNGEFKYKEGSLVSGDAAWYSPRGLPMQITSYPNHPYDIWFWYGREQKFIDTANRLNELTSTHTLEINTFGLKSTKFEPNHLLTADDDNYVVSSRVNIDKLKALETTSYYGGTATTSKIKIAINSNVAWMLSFVVTLYQGYRATRVLVSGYNYEVNHWYSPHAEILGDSEHSSLKVYFGYEQASEHFLYVGFDGGNYTGVTVDSVVNGYGQIEKYVSYSQAGTVDELFTITPETTLDNIQSTVTAYSPYLRSEGSTSATGNTIAVRHANGYLYATYFNQSSGAENPASYTSYAAFFSSDGFLRKSSKANFTTWLGFKWSGQTTVPNWLWGGNANNDFAVYSPHVIAGLKYLGATSSSTAKNFTISSYCTEIIVTGSFTGDGINKLFTSSVPKNLLSTTAREIWLGGGGGGTTGSQARCLCNVTLVNSTTVQIKGTAASNGTTNMLSSTTFYVYQR